MSELRRHGRELLEASRRERTPAAERRRRLLEKLLENAAQTSVAAREPPPLEQRLGLETKVLVAVGVLVTIAGGLWLASR
jgi:hypothetical protein